MHTLLFLVMFMLLRPIAVKSSILPVPISLITSRPFITVREDTAI